MELQWDDLGTAAPHRPLEAPSMGEKNNKINKNKITLMQFTTVQFIPTVSSLMASSQMCGHDQGKKSIYSCIYLYTPPVNPFMCGDAQEKVESNNPLHCKMNDMINCKEFGKLPNRCKEHQKFPFI